jgi:hypothetical protein
MMKEFRGCRNFRRRREAFWHVRASVDVASTTDEQDERRVGLAARTHNHALLDNVL